MFDGVKVLTLGLYSVNERIESNTRLYDDNRIQDARDPFVLLRYRISPAMVKMSELVYVEE